MRILFYLRVSVNIYCVTAGTDCPIGTYGNRTGLTVEDDCTECDAGYFCQTPGLVRPTLLCAAGHYCQLAATFATPSSEAFGYDCPLGTYCPEGTPVPVPCPRGYYQPDTGTNQALH